MINITTIKYKIYYNKYILCHRTNNHPIARVSMDDRKNRKKLPF